MSDKQSNVFYPACYMDLVTDLDKILKRKEALEKGEAETSDDYATLCDIIKQVTPQLEDGIYYVFAYLPGDTEKAVAERIKDKLNKDQNGWRVLLSRKTDKETQEKRWQFRFEKTTGIGSIMR